MKGTFCFTTNSSWSMNRALHQHRPQEELREDARISRTGKGNGVMREAKKHKPTLFTLIGNTHSVTEPPLLTCQSSSSVWHSRTVSAVQEKSEWMGPKGTRCACFHLNSGDEEESSFKSLLKEMFSDTRRKVASLHYSLIRHKLKRSFTWSQMLIFTNVSLHASCTAA